MRRTAVYAGTRNLYRHMTTAAKSLLCNTRMDRVWFLIEDEAFPEELPEVIRCMNVRDQEWFRTDGPNYRSAWTYMALMKLALDEVLDEKRVLWLDVDTIVEDDAGPLLEMDLEGKALAAVEEPRRGRHPFRYFNAGVMLMDLEKLWKSGKSREMRELVNAQRLDYPDQDAVNLVCQTCIRPVSADWNACKWTMNVPGPCIRHYAADKEYWEQEGFREYADREWRIKT